MRGDSARRQAIPPTFLFAIKRTIGREADRICSVQLRAESFRVTLGLRSHRKRH
jgi:hypothetical protein